MQNGIKMQKLTWQTIQNKAGRTAPILKTTVKTKTSGILSGQPKE